MSKHFIVAVSLFIAATLHSQAPKTINTRHMIWAGFSGEYKFSPKWSATLEGQFRFEYTDGDIYQWLVRPFATYQAGNGLRFSAGGAYASLYPNPNGKVPRPELRPWQEVGKKWQFGLHHVVYPRIRFEQRLIREYDGSELSDDFSLTFRLRLRADYNYLIHSGSGSLKWSLIVGEEILFNQKPSGFSAFDQNRVWTGIGYKFAPNSSVILLYLHVWQQRNSSVIDQAHVIRVTLQFTLAKRKEEQKK